MSEAKKLSPAVQAELDAAVKAATEKIAPIINDINQRIAEALAVKDREISALRLSLSEAREALEPFAKIGAEIPAAIGNDEWTDDFPALATVRLVGDYRRARAIHDKIKESENGSS